MNERRIDLQYAGDQPLRLDKYLADNLPEYSRSRLQALIKGGLVTINGLPARKTGQAVEPGARISLQVPATQPSHLQPEDIPLRVVFENADLLVVDKPAGMVVHPAAGHATGTLVQAALGHAPQMEGVGGEQRPGVVHRLDKDTSGLILMAKNDRAHHWLQDQFRLRKVQKVYLALVDGHPPTPTGRIEAPIGRHPQQRKQMAILTSPQSRSASSEYRTLESFARHTLLEVHPITGRTHQIRLHLAFIGCPVAGDTLYGYKHPTLSIGRHFLHAARLTICLPGENEPRTFEAPLPAELVQALELLRQNTLG